MKSFLLTLTAVMVAVTVCFGQSQKTQRVVTIDNQRYYVHTVAAGETLYSLARTYETDENEIKDNNPQLAETGLQAGQSIKIPYGRTRQERLSKREYNRLYDEHKVGPGENLYSIARRYALSVNTLIGDNPGLDPSALQIGSTLRIRKSEIGESSTSRIADQIEDVTQALSAVSDEYEYHTVVLGETLYSLSRMFNIEQSAIEANNDLTHGLKQGMIIKIPMLTEVVSAEEPEVAADNTLSGGWFDRLGNYADDDNELDIAMLLPISDRTGVKTNFVDFYHGSLIALDDLKKSGVTATLNLFDTEHSTDVTRDIVDDTAFRESDLIIGPVYEENMRYVFDFAERKGVPVVSPLASLNGDFGSVLYQLSPKADAKNDKLRQFFSPDKNIIFFTTTGTDSEFEKEMTALASGLQYRRVVYSKDIPIEDIDAMISDTKDNLFVVISGNETGVDMIMATLSSLQNNRTARTITTAPIKVIGSSKWLRYKNIERNLFFKLNVSLTTSYHADRSNEVVSEFSKRYLAAFGVFPTLYSYRGYDAVTLFADAVMQREGDFTMRLNNPRRRLLQVPYRFVQENGKWVNTEWVLVTYLSDYTITVE